MSEFKVGSRTKDSFLRLMRMLESSGGKNTNHKTVTYGPQAGTTAMGDSGLMPNTLKELANRKILKGNADLVDEQIKRVPADEVEYYIERFPEKKEEYESQLADKVLKTAGGDLGLAATAWKWGHNNSKGRLQKILQENPEYKSRVDKYSGSMGLQSGDDPENFVEYIDKLKGSK